MKNKTQSHFLTDAVPILGTMGAQSPFSVSIFATVGPIFLCSQSQILGTFIVYQGVAMKKEGGPMNFSKKKEAHANMDLLVKGDVALLGTQRCYGGSRLTSYAPERMSLNADNMEGTNE